MGVFVLIIISVVLLFYFLGKIDQKERDDRIKQNLDGAANLKTKYKTLINGLNPPSLNIKLIVENSRRLVYEYKTSYGTTRFYIIEQFQEVKVRWEFNHVLQGDHSKEWIFKDNTDQELMLNTIYDDMEQINEQFN